MKIAKAVISHVHIHTYSHLALLKTAFECEACSSQISESKESYSSEENAFTVSL